VADSVEAGICAKTLPPALKIQAHAAPLGMAFLQNATMFPQEYRGDMLLVLHGSWNRLIPVGPTVVRVRVRDGKPVSYEEFVTGWQTGYREATSGNRGTGIRWGRPADVLVYKDGSVLISDDQKGVIYRVYR
jgi:glucose/arabinose dehydrogenase